MQLPQTIEQQGIRVLTTKQIAREYEVKEQQISQNFKNNRTKFIEGKHYVSLSGDELKEFKKRFEKIEVVNSRASHLYLWTEKGALLHAKSLNTDKAWEVYDYLVDFYFRAKDKPLEEKKETLPQKNVSRRIKIENEAGICKAIQNIRDDLTCMDVLLRDCKHAEWESTYRNHRNAALDIISVIAKDFLYLMDLEPAVLEERCW